MVKEPVHVTADQLEAFRQLLTKEEEPLGMTPESTEKWINTLLFSVDNFRPVQKLGERRVLDVMTVQTLTKGSYTAPSHADRVTGMGVLVFFLVMIAMLRVVPL